jgi:hypothetical protein
MPRPLLPRVVPPSRAPRPALVLAALALSLLAAALLLGSGGAGGRLLRRLSRAPPPPLLTAALSAAQLRPGGGGGGSSNNDDSEPIHVAWTACGMPNKHEPDVYGLLSLKSLLIARANAQPRRRYVLHVLTNDRRDVMMRTSQMHYDIARYVAAEREPGLELRFYNLRDLDEAVSAFGGDGSLFPDTAFKVCAASRLKLPFALGADVKGLVYLDWDTVLTCDLQRLWRELRGFAPRELFGFALNDPTGLSSKNAYADKSNRIATPPLGGVSSGVMLLNVEALRRDGGRELRDYHDRIMRVIAEGVPNATMRRDFWALTAAFPLGDQDMLNAYLAQRPEVLRVLAPEWNSCLVEGVPFAQLRRAGIERVVPCVVHLCGQRLFTDMMVEDSTEEPSPDRTWLRALVAYVAGFPLLVPEEPPGPLDEEAGGRAAEAESALRRAQRWAAAAAA